MDEEEKILEFLMIHVSERKYSELGKNRTWYCGYFRVERRTRENNSITWNY